MSIPLTNVPQCHPIVHPFLSQDGKVEVQRRGRAGKMMMTLDEVVAFFKDREPEPGCAEAIAKQEVQPPSVAKVTV